MAEELERESTYTTASGEELEVTYERGGPPLPYMSNEVRYRMRNVPFFVLPPCESKAYNPAKVKAKIDTRNTSYVPARPKTSEGTTRSSASHKPRWSTSPVKSHSDFTSSIGSHRQDLTSPGKGRTGPGKVQTWTPRKDGGVGSGPSTPRKNSDETGEIGKTGSKTRKSSLPAYAHVKSKISTCWDKTGTQEIVGSADSSPASVRRGAKGNDKTKVGSVGRRVDYSHVTSRVDSCRSGSGEGARSKVSKREPGREGADQVDGKLASHKFSHSSNGFGLQQKNAKNPSVLKSPPYRGYGGSYGTSTAITKSGGTLSPIGGQKTSVKKMPAYTSPRNPYSNVKSKVDTSDPNPAHQLKRTISDLTIEEGRQINPRFSGSRSETTGAAHGNTVRNSTPKDRPTYSRIRGERANGIRSPFAKERTSGIRSPFTKERASSELISKEKMPSVRKGMGNQSSGVKRREIQPPRIHRVAAPSANILREDETEDLTAVVDNESPRQPTVAQAFAEDVTENESDSPPTGTGICGIEVSNNEIETTVVLKHILALAGKQNGNDKSPSVPDDLVIVEEDELEEEYYESKDKLKAPSEIPSSYNLPHLIPKLIVTTEDEDLVETVVPEARQLESSGLELVVSSSPLGRHFSPSAKILGGFDEEEEDDDSLSTHL